MAKKQYKIQLNYWDEEKEKEYIEQLEEFVQKQRKILNSNMSLRMLMVF